MSAFNFPSANAKPQTAAAGRNDKPAEFWLNVGINVQLPTGPDGALQDEFISLGGITIDNIEDAIVRATTTGKWALIGPAKNELLKLVREDFKVLPKGEGAVHPLLQVEARHAGEQVAAVAPAQIVSIMAARMGRAAA